MTQPAPDPFAALADEPPPPPQSDAIAWRYVIGTAVIALFAVIGAMVYVQHHGSTSHEQVASAQLQVLNAAAAKTAALNATHMDVTMTVSGGPAGTLTTSVGGDVSKRPVAGLVTGTLPGGLGDIEERVVGHTIYMRLGDRTFNGRPWMALHFGNDLSNAFGGIGDPLSMLRDLAGAEAVEDLGTATVDGVKTTHYHATLDPDAVYASLPKQFKALPDSAVTGHGAMTEDLYVAADGTVRRVENTVRIGGTTVRMQGRIRPIHHAVVVSAPPGDEVTHVANMAEALQLMSSAS